MNISTWLENGEFSLVCFEKRSILLPSCFSFFVGNKFNNQYLSSDFEIQHHIGYNCTQITYHKIPKWAPGLIFFKGPFWGAYFWRGLYSEGLMYGGKFCVSKSIGLACSGKEIYHYCFVLLCIRGQISSTSPPGGLYSEGWFKGGFFCITILGGLYLEGLIHGGAYFWNFRVH